MNRGKHAEKKNENDGMKERIKKKTKERKVRLIPESVGNKFCN